MALPRDKGIAVETMLFRQFKDHLNTERAITQELIS